MAILCVSVPSWEHACSSTTTILCQKDLSLLAIFCDLILGKHYFKMLSNYIYKIAAAVHHGIPSIPTAADHEVFLSGSYRRKHDSKRSN